MANGRTSAPTASLRRGGISSLGLTVFLCGDRCHRNGPQAAHNCRETAQRLHEYGQRKFMREQNATIEDFRREFGKNYLPEETDE